MRGLAALALGALLAACGVKNDPVPPTQAAGARGTAAEAPPEAPGPAGPRPERLYP